MYFLEHASACSIVELSKNIMLTNWRDSAEQHTKLNLKQPLGVEDGCYNCATTCVVALS